MLVVLLGDGPPITLHLTSEPVTLVAGVPLEVPKGYRDVLVRRDLTGAAVIVDYEAPSDPLPAPKAAPKKAAAKPQEA